MRSMRAADEKCALLACMYKRYSHLLFPISNGMPSVESRAFLIYFFQSFLIYFSLLKCHVIKLSGTQTKFFQIKTKHKTFQLTHTHPLRVTVTSQTSIVDAKYLVFSFNCQLYSKGNCFKFRKKKCCTVSRSSQEYIV